MPGSPNPFARADEAAASAVQQSSLQTAVVDKQLDGLVRVRFKNGTTQRCATLTDSLPEKDETVLVGTFEGETPIVVGRTGPTSTNDTGGGITEVFSGDYTRPNTTTWDITDEIGSVDPPITTKHAVVGDSLWFLEGVGGTPRMTEFDTVNETFSVSSAAPSALSTSTAKSAHQNGVIYVFLDSNDIVVEYDISADSWTTNATTAPFSDSGMDRGAHVYADGSIIHIVNESGDYYTYDPSADSFTEEFTTSLSIFSGDERILCERNSTIHLVHADNSNDETLLYEAASSDWNQIDALPSPGGSWGHLRPFYYDSNNEEIYGYIDLDSPDRFTALCWYSFSSDDITIGAITAVPKGEADGGIMGMDNSQDDVVLGPSTYSQTTNNIFEKTPPELDYEGNVVYSVSDEWESLQMYLQRATSLSGTTQTAYITNDFQTGDIEYTVTDLGVPAPPNSDILYGTEATDMKHFRYD